MHQARTYFNDDEVITECALLEERERILLFYVTVIYHTYSMREVYYETSPVKNVSIIIDLRHFFCIFTKKNLLNRL